MAEPRITEAVVSPGHDGQAELVVRVRYENGAVGTVTLDADCARVLMEDCAASTLEELRGQPWRHLLGVLRDWRAADAPER